MNRKLIMVLTLVFVIAFAFSVQAEVKDPIGVVKLRAGEPIHIAYWVVISGPNTSLGTDVVRGIEIAVDDFGGSIKGWPLKISGQDAGCSAEGGQAAATRLAADPTIVAAIGSTCSSAAKPGVPILWKAGIPSVSPSNTAPFLTDPERGSGYDL
jgi:branched-chain amino acid transport system substrate-binding protein